MTLEGRDRERFEAVTCGFKTTVMASSTIPKHVGMKREVCYTKGKNVLQKQRQPAMVVESNTRDIMHLSESIFP